MQNPHYLVSLVAASLTVTTYFSSLFRFGAFEGSLHWLPGFITRKMKLSGYGILRPTESAFSWSLARWTSKNKIFGDLAALQGYSS